MEVELDKFISLNCWRKYVLKSPFQFQDQNSGNSLNSEYWTLCIILQRNTPLPAKSKSITQVTVFLVGQNFYFFTLPYQYLWSDYFLYRWTAVFPNSFYPVTGLLVKKTAVTRTAYYPVTLVLQYSSPYFSLNVHHAFVNTAKTK